MIPTAIGAVLFTIIAGAMVYFNTQRQTSAATWVQHTQDVLSTLQRASLAVERIEYRTRQYALTADEDQLNRARTAANLLDTTTAHLQMLVVDNPTQAGSARDLAARTTALIQTLQEFSARSTVPEVQIQQCQQIVGLMTDREQWLLNERNKESQRTSVATVGIEIGFVALSLLTLIVLFGVLVRDALERQRTARQIMLTNEQLESTVKALEDRAQESDLLTSARDELQLCVNVQQVYRSAANGFSRLLAGTSGSLCVIDNSRHVAEVVAAWGETTVEDFGPPESCCGLRSGQPRWRRPGLSEIHCAHFSGEPPERYLCEPIVAHGDTLGVLYIQCDSDAAVQAVNRRMDGLRQLVQITGMAVATLNLQTKLEHQSIRDPLTGLFNRHFMQMSLDRELARAARRRNTLAVLMLDVDHFKRFNDTHGHVAGDTALTRIANTMQSCVRAEDIVCRYGGEEFTIILPDTTVSGACERAENLLQAVANLEVSMDTETHGEFSVSIGVAFFPNDGDGSDQLLRRADLALYRAKKLGRNQAALYQAAVMDS
jgi:diguanylate cyclase (GGDEF)-like protein